MNRRDGKEKEAKPDRSDGDGVSSRAPDAHRIVLLERLHRLVANFLHRGATNLFLPDGHRLGEFDAHSRLDGFVDAVGRLEHLLRRLVPANLLRPRLDLAARVRDRLVALLDGVQHLIDGEEIAESLDHHDGVLSTREDEVESAAGHLLGGGVEDGFRLAGEEADADAGDGLLEGHVGDGGGGGGGSNSESIGGSNAVVGEDPLEDLGVVGPTLGDHGSEGAIDEAPDEGFVLTHPAVALAISAGGLAHRAKSLLVIDGEGHETTVRGHLSAGAAGRVHHRLALRYHDRAVRLEADATRLYRHHGLADVQRQGLRGAIDDRVGEWTVRLDRRARASRAARHAARRSRAEGPERVGANRPSGASHDDGLGARAGRRGRAARGRRGRDAARHDL